MGRQRPLANVRYRPIADRRKRTHLVLFRWLAAAHLCLLKAQHFADFLTSRVDFDDRLVPGQNLGAPVFVVMGLGYRASPMAPRGSGRKDRCRVRAYLRWIELRFWKML